MLTLSGLLSFKAKENSKDVFLRSPWLVFCLLAGIVGMAYGMILWAPSIYDEAARLRDNPIFNEPFLRFWDVLTSRRYLLLTGFGTYHPLSDFVHYLLQHDPVYCRLAGIVLHVMNGFWVFLLCRNLAKDSRAAATASVLFVLFPTHTEAINISAFTSHLLSLNFTLLCLLCWGRMMEGGSRRGLLLSCSYVFYCLALLSKETGIVAVALLAAYTLCFHPEELVPAVKKGVGFLALTAAYLWVRFFFLEQPSHVLPAHAPDAAMAGLSFGWYLKMLLFPYPLCLEHTLGSGPSTGRLLGAAYGHGFPLLFASLLWIFRRRAFVSFCLLWIFLSCLPLVHLVPFANDSPVADRYLYMVSVGFCLLVCRAAVRPYMRYLAYGLVLAWGCLTISRNGLYLDSGRFFRQTAACAPDNVRAHALLASYYQDERDYPKALVILKKAVSLYPDQPGILAQLAAVHYLMGDYAAAEETMLAAMKTAPDWPDLHNNLGIFYAKLGSQDKALAQFRIARDLQPGWATPYANAGYLLMKSEPEKSLHALLAARLRDPGDFNVCQSVGEAYLKLGRPQSAIAAWKECLGLDPDSLDLWNRLGDIYLGTGDRVEARASFERVVKIADRALAELARMRSPTHVTQEAPSLSEIVSLQRDYARKRLQPLKKR